MIRAIVHQGFIGNAIEYFAVVAGPDVDRRFFFEQINAPRGDVIRYFGGSSEVVLNPEGVRFRGNGGIFGEYMFGGHLPVGDLLNEEVVNRLILFGTTVDRHHELHFTTNTEGFERYDSLFLQGNAVANYFFFVDDRKKYPDVGDRQEATLKSIGKLLKRSRKVGAGSFLALAHEVLATLDEPQTTLVIVRIVHRANQLFAEACNRAYAASRSMKEVGTALSELDIEPYQRERIQIDVIYHHRDNQELIDEYKRILASCAGSTIDSSARARLMRLRTLSLRNEVPLSIFDTLEEIVLQEPRAVAARKEDEPEYIQSTREILGGFLLGRNITRKLSSLDLVQLMENKQKAAAMRDQTFEEVLLETGRLIDEIGREEEDFERLESFGELVTLFDRIDHTTTLVNKLAFMDDVELSQEQVRSLLGNMQVFEKLRRGLFQQLFIDPVVNNEYALAYGKKKLYALTLGLISIENNEESIAGVAESIASLNHHERAYFAAYNLARRRMANFYLELNTAEGRETFRREIRAEIAHDPAHRELHEYMTEGLLEEVITKIRLEAFYINQLLPKIVEEQDVKLRNDFLSNSGLDRFQVEELESEYFELRAYPPQLLDVLRGSPERTQ